MDCFVQYEAVQFATWLALLAGALIRQGGLSLILRTAPNLISVCPDHQWGVVHMPAVCRCLWAWSVAIFIIVLDALHQYATIAYMS